jgi:hypothetical protein
VCGTVGALDVEPLGIGEVPLVAVGGGDGGDDAAALRDHRAGDLDVLRGDPYVAQVGAGRVEPEQLLHGRLQQVGFGVQGGVLVRVAQQHEQPARQGVHCGGIADHQQGHGEDDEVRLVEVPLVVARGHQRAEHVLRRLSALVVEQLVEVCPDALVRRDDLVVGEVADGEYPVRPAAQGVPVGLGYAEQFADERHRQRERQRFDEVDRPGSGLDPVQ